jgi:AcrR family transcriptional regulator
MTDPIQQQLIAIRKNQILDAAAVVFAEKGFHPTTIRDIARHAGIADGTIYNYFNSKTALLIGIFERMRDSIVQENLPLPTGEIDLQSFIRIFLQYALVSLQDDNFNLFRIIISEMMVNAELRELYYQQIMQPTLTTAQTYLQAYADDLGLSEGEAKLLLHTISALVQGMIIQRVMGDPILTKHWDTLPDFLSALFARGLSLGLVGGQS